MSGKEGESMAENNPSGSGGPGYRYGNGSGGSNSPRKNKNELREWIMIAVLFFLIPSGFTQLAAVIWAISKLAKMSKQQKQKFSSDVRQAADRVSRDAKKAAEQVRQEFSKEAAKRKEKAADTDAQTAEEKKTEPSGDVRYTYVPPKQETKGKKKKIKGGMGLLVNGIIFGSMFGLTAFILWLTVNVSGIPLAAAFTAVTMIFVAMIIGGVGKNRARDRYLNYLAYIGSNREVKLAHMAASFDVSVQKLCKDLRKMLAEGILPTGYLDLAEGKLYLTEMGYQAPEPQSEPQPMTEEQEDDILRQIRQVNDDIPDEVMSAKIDRIEEITGKILAYQKAHPDKAGQLRSFLNYYLPTTLKILRAYAQLDAQGIEGENISAAKARIEGMMDQVVAGFEKQLDKLFQDSAMDIASDVQVLENMLKKDGLSGSDNMTMTL